MPDLTRSSFDFHCGLESPSAFCRREWKAVVFFGGGFCLVMVAISRRRFLQEIAYVLAPMLVIGVMMLMSYQAFFWVFFYEGAASLRQRFVSTVTISRQSRMAISGQSYYMPDSALQSVAGRKDVYLVVECGTLDCCRSIPEWKNRIRDMHCRYGDFSYDSVFSVRSKWARTEMFRVKPAT
ncbi:MAG: hypothetical protein ABJC63_00520 [Gemmatimonadales bacterium]